MRIGGEGKAGDGRPPSREMVTDLDRAQARFDAGDAVRFAAGGGSWKTGAIEKLNPKRARVRCEDGAWDVPYRLLDHVDEPRGAGNEERLVEGARQARALMDEHGLHEWTFRFSAARAGSGSAGSANGSSGSAAATR